MGCFIGCFRGRDDNRRRSQKHLLPDSSVSKARANRDGEAVVSRNPLSSLFLAEETTDIPSKEVDATTPDSRKNIKDLKKEAKFLKACGTIMETPVEIKEASHKPRESPPVDREYDSIKHKNPFDRPFRPIELGQESEKKSGLSENSPSSCVTSEQTSRRFFLGSNEETARDNTAFKSLDLQLDNATISNDPCHLATENNGRSKSVRFDCDSKTPFSETKYVDFDRFCNEPEDPNTATPISKLAKKQSPNRNHMNVEASLSAWLKPVTSTKNQNCGDLSRANHNVGATLGEERPIIGMVAAHWYVDQPSRTPSKWWDGNGIPNSTNKYKEDQKVSWHATPFEKRLEKALSEESSTSQRKQIRKETIVFEEREESDTAISQLQSSSAHPKSVVSF